MGYTHYWYRPLSLDKESYDAWQADVRRVVEFTDVPIHSGTGFGPPTFKNGVTRLNGDGHEGDSHETFCIDREFNVDGFLGTNDKGWVFDFTKTARKPYDVVVVAALILLAYHFPEGCQISSDGDVSEWQDGLQLAQDATNRSYAIPFNDEQ